MTQDLERYEYKNLTQPMRHAAWLDAKGTMKREEIAREVGVHTNTVSAWRKWEGYQNEVARWRGVEMAVVEKRVLLILSEHMDLLEQARHGLLEAMTAEKDEGIPNWGVRLEAYKIIATHPATRRMFDTRETAADRPASNQIVTLHVHTTADGEEVVEIIEGEVDEEVSDGHREAPGDDRGQAAVAAEETAAAEA